MLKHGLQELYASKIILPGKTANRPNRDYLQERFAKFRAASPGGPRLDTARPAIFAPAQQYQTGAFGILQGMFFRTVQARASSGAGHGSRAPK